MSLIDSLIDNMDAAIGFEVKLSREYLFQLKQEQEQARAEAFEEAAMVAEEMALTALQLNENETNDFIADEYRASAGSYRAVAAAIRIREKGKSYVE